MREQFYTMVKEIYGMELKKGDGIKITFTDGEVIEAKIDAIRYADKGFGRNNKELHYMKLEYKKPDGDIYVADIDRMQSVEVTSRNTRAKKLLTSNCKLLTERIQQGYFEL